VNDAALVAALTDEELCALDGGPAAVHVAPRPWLDSQEESLREYACVVATRGLTARGLVAPAERDGQLALQAAGPIANALDLRRGAPVIVCAQRRSTAGSAFRVLYVHDDTLLEEDITDGGLHCFGTMDRGVAAARLAGFADPETRGRDVPDRGVRVMPVDEVSDEGSGMGRVLYVTAIARADADADGTGPERRVTVYARNDAVLLAEPADGSTEPPQVTVREVSPAQLGDALAQFLTAQEASTR
jgi:hypothetical protein